MPILTDKTAKTLNIAGIISIVVGSAAITLGQGDVENAYSIAGYVINALGLLRMAIAAFSKTK
jgi:hypothetical protein